MRVIRDYSVRDNKRQLYVQRNLHRFGANNTKTIFVSYKHLAICNYKTKQLHDRLEIAVTYFLPRKYSSTSENRKDHLLYIFFTFLSSHLKIWGYTLC